MEFLTHMDNVMVIIKFAQGNPIYGQVNITLCFVIAYNIKIKPWFHVNVHDTLTSIKLWPKQCLLSLQSRNSDSDLIIMSIPKALILSS